LRQLHKENTTGENKSRVLEKIKQAHHHASKCIRVSKPCSQLKYLMKMLILSLQLQNPQKRKRVVIIILLSRKQNSRGIENKRMKVFQQEILQEDMDQQHQEITTVV